MTLKKLFAVIILFSVLPALKLKAGSHEITYKFWVELKDKSGNNYTILKPWDFLSERALARRRKAGISVTMADLPVSPLYLTEVQNCGAKILLTSRWMNAILIQTTDSGIVSRLNRETYVKKVTLMGYWNRSRGAAAADPESVEEYVGMDYNASGHISVKNQANADEYNEGYGMGWDQTKMLNVQTMHKRGFRGKGVWIAVLDAGFYNANLLGAFDSLRANKQILGSVDFVDRDGNVYNDDDHGTQVLGCMASNVPGIMVGTAPDANYLLLRTEDAHTEFPAEEAQWLAAAEYADSVGVDVINSSLGYTEFDKTEFGHTYAELDGHTALITLAANMAYERGIVIVNSAGNEGDEKWEKIGAPADAVGVIAVAAVDRDGERAGFSSMGPTSDKRYKPDLAALGKRAIIAGSSGYFYGSNGTSYSAPILTGAVACFMQANPDLLPADVRKLICMSASNYLEQDTFLGFGIPDFELACQLASKSSSVDSLANPFLTWPQADTLYTNIELKTNIDPQQKYVYTIEDSQNKIIASGTIARNEELIYAARLRFGSDGWYSLLVTDGNRKWKKRVYLIKP